MIMQAVLRAQAPVAAAPLNRRVVTPRPGPASPRPIVRSPMCAIYPAGRVLRPRGPLGAPGPGHTDAHGEAPPRGPHVARRPASAVKVSRS